MYAKLMSRITESSLMDEAIPVRYTFVMLLAVADPQGYVVGTDVAIARRLNMPVDDFKACISELMKPDPDSNSKEEEGRRVVFSDCERGYFLVNYQKYRDTRDEEQRREYMRDYMRKYRGAKDVAPVNSCKHGKPQLAKEEAHADAHEKEEADSKEELSASRKTKPKASGYSVPECFESVEGFSAALAAWIEMRNKKRNPPTGHAIQLLINRLTEKPDKAVSALNVAIESGWQTVKWEWIDNYNSRNGRPKEPETYRLTPTDKDVWRP